MTEGRPHLVAVPEAKEPAPARVKRRSSRLPWLLAVLALLCGVGWAFAQRHASQLARELAASQSALSEATRTLEAMESQRSEARSQLEALSTEANALAERLAGVRELLAPAPGRADDAQAGRSEAPAGD